MSNARSRVLGEDVKAGEVGSKKIDGATGDRRRSVFFLALPILKAEFGRNEHHIGD